VRVGPAICPYPEKLLLQAFCYYYRLYIYRLSIYDVSIGHYTWFVVLVTNSLATTEKHTTGKLPPHCQGNRSQPERMLAMKEHRKGFANALLGEKPETNKNPHG
jgi:hypothetical protein